MIIIEKRINYMVFIVLFCFSSCIIIPFGRVGSAAISNEQVLVERAIIRRHFDRLMSIDLSQKAIYCISIRCMPLLLVHTKNRKPCGSCKSVLDNIVQLAKQCMKINDSQQDEINNSRVIRRPAVGNDLFFSLFSHSLFRSLVIHRPRSTSP